MNRTNRNQWFTVLFLLASGFFFIHIRYERDLVVQEIPKVSTECQCVSKKSGKMHNFCYTDPQNLKSIGRKFECENLEILEQLGLVDNSLSTVDLASKSRNEADEIFLSATSDDHFTQSMTSIRTLRRFYPTHKFILYGLDLSESLQKKAEEMEYVEFRQFQYSKYPSFVKIWMQYRFKPLIIAEVLLEYQNIWWMDAHIQFKNGNMTQLLYEEIAEKQVSPIVFFTHSSHSNYAVLHQKLLDYFPSNSIDLLKSADVGAQLGANMFYVARTNFTMEILKWWILCALDEICMNPPGAQVYCRFGKNRFDYFANCFRFDQSVINLLLLNHFGDYKKYRSRNENIF